MSDFDPYHKWLGIAPEEQPPNHYRLLAIRLFEDDCDVIQNAADQRMAHLRRFQIGQHALHSQRLLNEVAAAQLCLLRPDRKSVYDAQLREQIVGTLQSSPVPVPPTQLVPPPVAVVPAATPPPLPPAVVPPTPTSPAAPSDPGDDASWKTPLNTGPPGVATVRSDRPTHERPGHSVGGRAIRGAKAVSRPGWLLTLAGGICAVLLIGVLAVFVNRGSKPEEPGPALAQLVLNWPEPFRDGATLELDGRSIVYSREAVATTTDRVILEVSPGKHELSIRWKDHPQFDAEFTLDGAASHEIDVEPPAPEVVPVRIPQPGLLGEYFQGDDFSKKVKEGVDKNINFHWDYDAPEVGLPADRFRVRWQGYIKAPVAGRYQIVVDADDSLQVKVDNQVVCQANCDDATGEVELTGKPQRIEMDFREADAYAHAVVCWALPGVFPRQVISSDYFFVDESSALAVDVPKTVARSLPVVDESSSNPQVDLLRWIDPAVHTIADNWWFDGTALVCSRNLNEPDANTFSALQIPFDPPSWEYRLTAEIERCVADDLFEVGLATKVGFPQARLGSHPKSGGRSVILGVTDAPPIVAGTRLPRGKISNVEYLVTSGGIEMKVDGQLVQSWKGDMATLPQQELAGAKQGRFVLRSYHTSFRIHKLTWESVASEPDKTVATAKPVESQKVVPEAAPAEPSPPPKPRPVVPIAIRSLEYYEGRNPKHRPMLCGLYGGTKATEDSVALALEWLAYAQLEDGGWSFEFPREDGQGRAAQARAGATAAALMAFFGAGMSHRDGAHKSKISKGMVFLSSRGKQTGRMLSFHEPEGTMYSHALATMALSEAYAVVPEVRLATALRGAISFTINAQHEGGGWRYDPGNPGDTSVTAWQLASLRGCLNGPFQQDEMRRMQAALSTGGLFLLSASSDSGARFKYDAGTEPTKQMTAAGLAGWIYVGFPTNEPPFKSGLDFLDKTGPDPADLYYTYYGTQVMRHTGGARWQRWNRAIRKQLVEAQVKVGPQRGSWHFAGQDLVATRGGRLMQTVLATLILESYYRHMPLRPEGWEIGE